MLGTPIALQGLGDVVRIVVAVGVAQLRAVLWMRAPAMMALIMAMPVTPVMSLTTWVSLRCICLQRLVPLLNMVGGIGQEHVAVTQEPRSTQTWSAGRKRQRAAHRYAGVAATCRRADRFSGGRGHAWLTGIDAEHLHAAGLQPCEQGHPVDPVDAIATVVTPQARSQAARASRSMVNVPKRRTAGGRNLAARRPSARLRRCSMPAAWVADLEGFREHGRRREQKGRWPRAGKESLWVSWSSRSRKQYRGLPWGRE